MEEIHEQIKIVTSKLSHKNCLCKQGFRLVNIIIWNDRFSANYIDIVRDIVVFTATFSYLWHNL
jgi:hypothetical protein